MPTATVTAEALAEELEAHLDVYIRCVPSEPTFVPLPVVLPAGAKGFALRDPASVDATNPKGWNSGPAKTGNISRGNYQGSPAPRVLPGRPYPKNHPSARLFTADELEALKGTVDTSDGSPLDLAHQASEQLYSKIEEATKAAGVRPGLRAAFVVKFVAAKLPEGYFRERTDEDRAANLGRCVAHAIAAAGLKEPLIAEYEARIAAAETAEIEAEIEAAEVPSHDRIAAAEATIAALKATVAQLSARVFTAPPGA